MGESVESAKNLRDVRKIRAEIKLKPNLGFDKRSVLKDLRQSKTKEF